MDKLGVIAEIVPKGEFPVVSSENIQAGNKRLDAALTEAATEVSKKADKEYVDTEVSKKTSKTYVDDELAKKASKAELTEALSEKANVADVNSALVNKADSSALRNTNEALANLETETDVLSARMDTFTNLPEGSTTGDAELADGRIGADGKTYSNIGGAIRGQVTDLKSDLTDLVENYIEIGEMIEGQYWNRSDGNTAIASDSKRSALIPVKGGSRIRLHDVSMRGSRGAWCYRQDRSALGKLYDSSSELTDFVVDVPKSACYIGISALKTQNPKLTYVHEIDNGLIVSMYVSPNGDDNNDGRSYYSSLKTVNKALEKGADTILLRNGIYEQNIDLSLSKHDILTIKTTSISENTVFRNPDSLLADAESKVNGYTNVYSSSCKVIPTDLLWIWQDGYFDSKTTISDYERHPLQRGYTNRLNDTKIVKCTSVSKNEALHEIDSSNEYKWYYENGILYFSRPIAVTTQYSLRCDYNAYKLFINPISNYNRNISVNISGITTKYMCFNVESLNGASVTDCRAMYSTSNGCFVYDKTIDVTFKRCEAVGCQCDINGDGFNAHSQSTGDIDSKQTTCTLIDCWAHDNKDDGYSDHERSEITIIGGLYEYNGKAGVTPSYGSHATCYDVISRHNFNGFFCTGTAAASEGGKYSQLICFNCVSANNFRDDSSDGDGYRVDGTGNKLTLINCKSINDRYGYCAVSVENIVEMIDCGCKSPIKGTRRGSGTFVINNTELVV